MSDTLRICSGQSYFTRKRNPDAPDWGICLAGDLLRKCPWWRLSDRAGRQRRFRTPEGAERHRARLEVALAPHAAEIADAAERTHTDEERNAFGAMLDNMLRQQEDES